MKAITILTITILLNACGGAKEVSAETVTADTTPKTEVPVKSQKQQIQDETVVFEYSAISRGVFKNVKITKELVSVKANRTQETQTKQCSEALWGKLISLLDEVNLESIPKYEQPNKAHQHDGALAATLKITHQGTTYETLTFDHGKPNKELYSLVEVLVAMGISD